LQLIVGLGNPGAQYARTRHNAGFWFVDRLAEQARTCFKTERKYHAEIAALSIGGIARTVLKPTTFMNNSGTSVSAYANYFRISPSEILVVHDELDFEPGIVRLKRSGGHGGHNGLRDITAHIGADFARLRIGIGHPGTAEQVVDYVLTTPSATDRAAIEEALERAVGLLPDIVGGKFDRVMNDLNRKQPANAADAGPRN
jgi:peptidyl-tRNA hydrolase, PTH1 family